MLGKTWEIHCANCGGEDTHQMIVTAYSRDSEDAATGLAAHIVQDGTGGGVTCAHGDMKYNPSPRRDGLSITLRCEHCPAQTQIHILQHKGKTYLSRAVVVESTVTF